MQLGDQFALVDRLGQVVRHAQREVFLAVAGHGVGRQRDHRQVFPARLGAQALDRFLAVHDRHVDVEQDDVEFMLGDEVQRFLAVGRLGDVAALRREEQLDDLAVDGVVVGQQHAQAAQAALGRLGDALGRGGRGAGGRGFLRAEGEAEGRALAGIAGDGDVAAHHARQLARDGKAEARAAELARGGAIGLREHGEQLGLHFLRHADAGIADFHGNEIIPALDARRADRDFDAALVGELDRVGDQVARRTGARAWDRRSGAAGNARHSAPAGRGPSRRRWPGTAGACASSYAGNHPARRKSPSSRLRSW